MENDLISRSDLLNVKPEFLNEKIVCDTKYRTTKERVYAKAWNSCNDCWIDTIENALTVERPQGKWIPASERLPNRNGLYNVTRKLKEGKTIYYISDASYFDGQNTWHADTRINHGIPYLTDVIAWQPLPEPYKRDNKE